MSRIQSQSFLSLYDGLTAQILRQMTYTTLRFHLYNMGKRYVDENEFHNKVIVASISGLMAGLIGIPSEMINTRMHVDRVLPEKYRRNYRHVFHALRKVYRDEGFRALYTGGLFSCLRAGMVTIGQNAVYDQIKMMCIEYYDWDEGSKLLHLVSSLTAGIICTPLVQPIEIIKTVQMTASGGYLGTTWAKVKYMLSFGPTGLFRGLSPSLLRMVPSTIIMFILYEQLRLNFGYYDNKLTGTLE